MLLTKDHYLLEKYGNQKGLSNGKLTISLLIYIASEPDYRIYRLSK